MNNRIIVMLDHEDQEFNVTLYNFIEIQYKAGNPILVCHVTNEEYEIMKEQINKRGFLDERLSRITKDEMEYNKFRYLLGYDPKYGVINIANYNEEEMLGSYTIDANGIHYNEDKRQFPKLPGCLTAGMARGIRVYTTETYENVIKHYKKHKLQ